MRKETEKPQSLVEETHLQINVMTEVVKKADQQGAIPNVSQKLGQKSLYRIRGHFYSNSALQLFK